MSAGGVHEVADDSEHQHGQYLTADVVDMDPAGATVVARQQEVEDHPGHGQEPTDPGSDRLRAMPVDAVEGHAHEQTGGHRDHDHLEGARVTHPGHPRGAENDPDHQAEGADRSDLAEVEGHGGDGGAGGTSGTGRSEHRNPLSLLQGKRMFRPFSLL